MKKMKNARRPASSYRPVIVLEPALVKDLPKLPVRAKK